MAHKDFVKRGKAPNKKKTAPKKAAPKQTIPWVRLVITVLLVASFGYFLWAISQSDAPSMPTDEPATEALPQAPAEEPDALPEMLADEYSYPSELAQGNVEIEMREQQKSERPYLMQCGSFRQQQQADKMRVQLAMQGLESQVRPSNGTNGRWYRVILGPYDFKRDAETDRHIIQNIGISTCQIWYWDL